MDPPRGRGEKVWTEEKRHSRGKKGRKRFPNTKKCTSGRIT